MKTNWQIKLLLFLGAICLTVIFLVDFRGVQSIFAFIFSCLLVFFGHKLYEGETSENWLDSSFFSSATNVIGGILILFGWIIFLESVLAVAMASLILWLK